MGQRDTDSHKSLPSMLKAQHKKEREGERNKRGRAGRRVGGRKRSGSKKREKYYWIDK